MRNSQIFRTLLLTIPCLLIVNSAKAQWLTNVPTINSVDLIYRTGHVGIGIIAPTVPLHVAGNTILGGTVVVGTTTVNSTKLEVNGWIKSIASGTNRALGQFYATGTGDAGIFFDASDGNGVGSDYGSLLQNDDLSIELNNYGNNPIYFKTDKADRLTILGNGNVGVGTDAPSTNLVIKDILDDVRLRFEYDVSGTSTSSEIFVNGSGMNFKNYNGSRNFLFTSGNVGVGTASPFQRLEVANGGLQVTGNITAPTSPTSAYLVDYIGGVSRYWSRGIDDATRGGFVWNILTNTGLNQLAAMTIKEDGNVGIGTPAPEAKLDVDGEAIFRAQDNTFGIAAHIRDLNGINSMTLRALSTKAEIVVQNSRDFMIKDDDDHIFFYGRNGGNVGIGTISPTQKLEVAGIIMAQNEIQSKSGNPGFLLSETDIIDKNWHLQVNGGDFKFYEVDDNRSNWSQKMIIKNTSGNVGIGTTDPGDYKLAVEGKVGARSFRVTTASWADYVFAPSYQLMPLTEVENYIQQNQHLPNVPSAQEVEENGFELEEMDAKLMEKVEELTLYIIQQEKNSQEQNSRIEKLEKELKALQTK